MKKLAVTGFGVFGKNSVNPTESLVSYLSSRSDINGAVIPVSYRRSIECEEKMEGDAALMLGLAQGRDRITVERYAYNKRKASIPDNDGVIATGESIAEGGEWRLETDVDTERIVGALLNEGIAAAVSEDPGRYVCNNVYYGALARNSRPSLFVHFPSFVTMGRAEQEKAVTIIADTLLSMV